MLEGRNLILRLFAAGDVDEFCTLEARVTERGEFYPANLRSTVEARKRFDETGWWEEDKGRMLITDKDGRVLGGIGFFKPSQYQTGYEIGYAVFRPEDRGKGVMTAALRIFSAYLFEAKDTPRLQIVTSTGNVPSRRIAEKCGYRYEGTLRQFFFMRGTHHDCDILSLLRDECVPLQEALQS